MWETLFDVVSQITMAQKSKLTGPELLAAVVVDMVSLVE